MAHNYDFQSYRKSRSCSDVYLNFNRDILSLYENKHLHTYLQHGS